MKKSSVIVNCAQCSKEISRQPNQLKKSEQSFCSRECKGKWQSKNLTGEKALHWIDGLSKIKKYKHIPKSGIFVTCANCGKSIIKNISMLRNRKNHFCNQECRGQWDSAHRTGENSAHWNGGKVTVNCAQCGKELQRIRSEVESRSENFFCDIYCRGKWDSKNRVGSKASRWEGGTITNRGPDWQLQKEKAIKRDNNTCQHCGVRDTALSVHHIIPFREFGYIAGSNTNYKEANSLENLVTLCQKCHFKADTEIRRNKKVWA